jgi:hypothetical protein
MRHTTVQQNKRGVRCSDCGPTLGTSANIGQGGLRCCNCGQFAEPCETYCAKHEVHWGGVTGYDHCPRCRQENRVERARAEQSFTGHNMHPSVDARRR